MSTPKKYYQEALESGEYQPDPRQAQAVDALQRVYEELCQKRKKSFLNRFGFQDKPVKGLYLWGGVGIGKTWLMDLFFKCLPEQRRLRMHFHRFMRQVQTGLKRIQGEKDPLKKIAKHFAKQTDILCFDEFFVSDITDAMILAELFQALFAEGVSLVTTSNIAPDDLYKNGLQRDRFLPAIELIKQHCEILHMPTEQDYRLRTLEQAGVYYHPLGEDTRAHMRSRFEEMAGEHWQDGELLIVEGRAIPTIRLASGVAWFRFQDLCDIPRSQVDYLEIARSFHTVLLSSVPQIQANQTDLITYLIMLIDILYDTGTKLVMSSQVPMEELYPKGRMRFEFKRTLSRLQEMQSLEYLQKPHEH